MERNLFSFVRFSVFRWLCTVAVTGFLSTGVSWAQCSFTLRSQADVDNFWLNFPEESCPEIHTLTINGDDITNLKKLSGRSIGLSYIEGGVFIFGNPLLSSLEGLKLTQTANLNISDNPKLSDISALSSLYSISFGGLSIHGNPELTNIDALSSLEEVSGIYISNNDNLVNLNGLSKITGLTAPGELFIQNNSLLTDISGLANIDFNTIERLIIKENPELSVCELDNICGYLKTGRPLEITGNNENCQNEEALKSLCNVCPTGMVFNTQKQISDFFSDNPTCNEIKGDVTISGDDITNLGGLWLLNKIEGNLSIVNCPQLTNINGLEGLTRIKGELQIVANNTLNDISGIRNIDYSTITFLKLTDNASLSSCKVANICAYLSDDKLREISGNNGYCDSDEDLKSICSPSCSQNFVFNTQQQVNDFGLYFHCTYINGDVLISGNDITTLGPLSSVQSIIGKLEISGNSQLSDVGGFSSLKEINGDLIISNNAGLKNSNFSSLQSINGRLEISGNFQLSDIDGFSSLTNIYGDLIVDSNAELGNVSFLPLQNINGRLKISGNSEVSNIDGFPSLKYIGGGLSLVSNPALKSINLSSLESVIGKLEISGNSLLSGTDGFSSLKNVEGDLILSSNPALTGINGLPLLESVWGNFEIYNNAILTSVDLPSLQNTTGSFKIYSNPEINNLSISSLEGIGGDFILDNTKLTDLNGLISLQNITGGFTLSENATLTDASGIQNLNTDGVTFVNITNNNSLTLCNFPNICSLMGSPGSGRLTVSGNAGTCTDKDALFQACNLQTYIPDDSFEQALIDMGYDDVLDDYVVTQNIASIISLDVSNRDISDLTGIEAFVELRWLTVNNNISNNKLASIDLSHNTELIYLSLMSNLLTSLDLSYNPKLFSLNILDNQITNLDLSHNPELYNVNVGFNPLSSLDISNNIAIAELYISANYLTNLDLSKNTALKIIEAYNNNFTSLDLSHNSELEQLNVQYSQLTNLDLSHNLKLERLAVDENKLTSLSVNNNSVIKTISAENNLITSLDLTNNSLLESLSVPGNQLVNLDLSNNPALTYLVAGSNLLESLNLKNGGSSNMSYFDAKNNPGLGCVKVDDPAYFNTYWKPQVDSWVTFGEACQGMRVTYVPDDAFEQALITLGLDDVLDDYVVTKNIANLTSLDISNRSISDLTGIGDFNSLETLILSGNQLTSLSLDNNSALRELKVDNNQLTDLYLYLPSLKNLNANNNQLTILNTGSLEELENLDVGNNQLTQLYLYNPLLKNLNAANNQLAYNFSTSDIPLLENLDVSNSGLNNLNLEYNTMLKTANLSNNSLNSLTLGNNSVLEILNLSNNNIYNLPDVSGLTGLQDLRLSDNQLTSIDFGHNLSLTTLYVNNNRLGSLNVENLTGLSNLNAENNNLIYLNVKNGNNTAFSLFNVTGNPNLACVQVDNATYSATNWTNKDSGTTYSETCDVPKTYVPDDAFEQALIDMGYDDVPDDYVTTTNIMLVEYLQINSRGITDLTGIEDFTGLTYLAAPDNSFSSLDVSNNTHLQYLNLSNNKLTSLDVSNNAQLQYLNLSNNKLTSPDLSLNGNLQTLLVDNNQLTELDVSQNPALFNLSVADNHLTYLNLKNGTSSSNTYFLFKAKNNPHLTCIEVDNPAYATANWAGFVDAGVTFSNVCVSKTYVPDNGFEQALIDLGYDDVLDDYVATDNIAGITSLNLNSQGISDLTGIEDFTALKFLNLTENQLSSLDLSLNTVLESLYAGDNQLTSIDLSKNTGLKSLSLEKNKLISLDLNYNAALTSLIVSGNSLSSIDLGHNPALSTLFAGQNQLTAIDLSHNPALVRLDVNENLLTTIDLSQNPALVSLSIMYNYLTEIDLSHNPVLEGLMISQNQLTTLDLSHNPVLQHIYLYGNRLQSLNVKNGNNSSIVAFQANGNPNLTCIQVDNVAYSTASWKTIDTGVTFRENCNALQTHVPDDAFEQALIDQGYDDVLDNYVLTDQIDAITSLDISNLGVSDLTGIEDFAALKTLRVPGNQLTALDLSHNTAVELVEAANNLISSVDFSKNTALYYIGLNGNKLTSLDLSRNTALTTLYATANLLPSIDLSHNPELRWLEIGRNQLTEIDFTHNLKLQSFEGSNNLLTSLDVSKNTQLMSGLSVQNNRLQQLNVKNDRNASLVIFNALNNPDLICIEVDDPAYSTSNWTNVGSGVRFSVDCDLPTCPVDISFTTQQQIADFKLNYFGCKQISGNVLISGDDIRNLDGLAAVETIGGYLHIVENPLLENTTGLSALTAINGALLVESNDILTDLSGLKNISSGSISLLTIWNNAALSLCNLPNFCAFLSTSKPRRIDENGGSCADETALIAACAPLSLTRTTQTNVTYYGGNNGSATVSAAGGKAPYTYQWAPEGGNEATATSLAAGDYTVTATDDDGQTAQLQIRITQPVAPDLVSQPSTTIQTDSVTGEPGIDWRYFYKSTDNQLILAVYNEHVDESELNISSRLNEWFGTDTTNTLDSPFGKQGETFRPINRSWSVTTTATPDGPVAVRFFIGPDDLDDLGEGIRLEDLVVYKVDGNDPYDPNASGYTEYVYGSAPTLNTFTTGSFQGVTYVEFLLNSFSSGSVALITKSEAPEVALENFSGVLEQEESARLTWATTAEKAFSGFEIEKSPDGTHFTQAGSVNAKGPGEYEFTVVQAEEKVYYRLKMTGKDQTLYQYSPVITVIKTKISLRITEKTNPTVCGTATGGLMFLTNLSNGAYPLQFRKGSKDTTANVIVRSGSFTLTPLAAGTYSAFSLISGKNSYQADTSVVLNDPEVKLALDKVTSPVACGGKGSIAFTTDLPGGKYVLKFRKGTTSLTGEIEVMAGKFILDTLRAGAYSEFSLVAGACTVKIQETVTLVDPAAPSGVITPDGPTELCEDDEVTLTAAEGASYLWSNGKTTRSITVSEAGTYKVKVTSAQGCESNAEIKVEKKICNLPPVAVCKPLVVIVANPNDCYSVVTPKDLDAGSYDPNGDWTRHSLLNTDGIFRPGTYTVTYEVMDPKGAFSTCQSEVRILDHTPPVARARDLNLELDANGRATISLADVDAGSYDNCGPVTLSLNRTTFDCSDLGNLQVRLTVTDASGNVSEALSDITISDNTPPVIQANNVTLTLDENGRATVSTESLTGSISDNCGIWDISVSQNEFTCEHLGENTVIITVQDVRGNRSTATVTVTVLDNTPPVINIRPVTLYLDATGKATLTATEVDNGSKDNCGITGMSLDRQSFDCTDLGDQQLTLTATDAAGNTSDTTFTVTVLDTLAPVVQAKDITLYLDEAGQASLGPEDIDEGSSDNCGIAERKLQYSTFSCSDTGTRAVEYTVTDGSGNHTTVIVQVSIRDTLAPEAIAQNVVLELDWDGKATLAASEADGGSSDNCSIAEMSLSQADFSCTDLGRRLVTLTVKDVNGNQATARAVVEVKDPNGVCPCSYGVLAFDGIKLKDNEVSAGGVGVINRGKKVKLRNTVINKEGTFVKAPENSFDKESEASTYLRGKAPEPEGFRKNGNKVKKKEKAGKAESLTLGAGNYGKVKAGKEATITFSGGDIFIRSLKVGKGVNLVFTDNTVLLVRKAVKLGKNTAVNTAGEQMRIYAGGNVSIGNGSEVRGYLHSQGRLKTRRGGEITSLEGLFVADRIRGGKNTHWAGGGVMCTANEESEALLASGKERRKTQSARELPADSVLNEESIKISVFPNPASEQIRVEVNADTDGGELLLTDLQGNVKMRKTYTGQSSVQEINIKEYPTGLYLLKVSHKGKSRTVRVFKE